MRALLPKTPSLVGILALCAAILAATKPNRPATEPAAETIRPGDEVIVKIGDLDGPGVETVKRLRVNEAGSIDVPYIGDLAVAGQRPIDSEGSIIKAYREARILNDAPVSVSIVKAVEHKNRDRQGAGVAPGSLRPATEPSR